MCVLIYTLNNPVSLHLFKCVCTKHAHYVTFSTSHILISFVALNNFITSLYFHCMLLLVLDLCILWIVWLVCDHSNYINIIMKWHTAKSNLCLVSLVWFGRLFRCVSHPNTQTLFKPADANLWAQDFYSTAYCCDGRTNVWPILVAFRTTWNRSNNWIVRLPPDCWSYFDALNTNVLINALSVWTLPHTDGMQTASRRCERVNGSSNSTTCRTVCRSIRSDIRAPVPSYWRTSSIRCCRRCQC